VGPPCSGQQRTGTPALGKPRKRCPSDGDRGFESTSLQRRVEREPDLAPWNRSPRSVPGRAICLPASEGVGPRVRIRLAPAESLRTFGT
jgi:hypothetical protein